MTGFAARALADGGAGGSNAFGATPGSGGTGYHGTGTGGNAGGISPAAGGGGGGAGGAAGGNGSGSGNIAGGAGGTALSPNGVSPVANGNGGGGGGGGGGFNGNGAGSVSINNGAPLAGGTGGNGGLGSLGGGGGGGGAGGYGAVVTGATSNTNTSTIAGGSGGNGGGGGTFGAGYGNGGSGGAGGVGLQFVNPGATLINGGTVTGGNGGLAGAGGANSGGGAGTAGTPGLGGVAIVGSGLTIDNTGGVIQGGIANAGTGVQAYAVQFTGGTNFVSTGGTIIGGINVAGGSFQPSLNGSAVGATLATSGPIGFVPGSFYNIRITPTATDSVTATGAATLTGANVNVAAGAGSYTTRQYTILTATGGRGGTTFAGVTSNLAFLTPTLTYDANNVFLNVTGNAVAQAGGVDYRSAAATQNQRAVAGGLTSASNANGNTGAILTAFNQLTVPQAQAAFDSISGEGIAAAQNIAYRSSSLFVSSIFDQTTFYGAGAANSVMLTDARPNPLAYVATRAQNSPIVTRDTVVPANRTWRAWTTGFGAGENIRGDAGVGTAAQTNSVYGGTLGVDYQFASNYLTGVAFGGTDGSFSVGGRNSSGRTTGGHAAFYTLANFGAFYGAGTSSVSFFGNRTTRTIAGFGGLAGETERGNFASREFRSRAEFGWHTGLYGATLTPFVALEIAQLRSNGFTEGALAGPGLLALNVQGQTGASVPGYVGARLARSFLLDNGKVFTPTIQAAYLHEFGPQRTLTAGLVNLPGSTFLVDGARASSNAAQVKAGADVTLTANLRAFANFEGEFSGVEQVYAGKGGLRYSW